MWPEAFLEDPRQPSCPEHPPAGCPAASPAPSVCACNPPASSRPLRGASSPRRARPGGGSSFYGPCPLWGLGPGDCGRLGPPRSGCELPGAGSPVDPRSELFPAVLPSPRSVERPRRPSSRSLPSLQKAVLPRMQMSQGLGRGWGVNRHRAGVERGEEGRQMRKVWAPTRAFRPLYFVLLRQLRLGTASLLGSDKAGGGGRAARSHFSLLH